MVGDNSVFNVNGMSREQLTLTLKLATLREHGDHQTITHWKILKDKGLVLMWAKPDDDKMAQQFITPLTGEEVKWLHSEHIDRSGGANKRIPMSKMFPMEGWDANADHDGSNEIGWRVYCEDWGHVGGELYAIVAIKPAYIWYGK